MNNVIQCHSFSSPALHSVAYLGFQYSSCPFLSVSDSCMPICCSHFLQIFLTLSIHLFCGLPLFLIPSHLALTVWHSLLFTPSPCSYHLNLSDFICYTMYFLCNISLSPYLFLFASFVLLLCTMKASYSLLWNTWEVSFLLKSFFRLLACSLRWVLLKLDTFLV